MWRRNRIHNSAVLIRRSAFEALGGFNEARQLISVEDYNLWLRVAASEWKIITCPQPLCHYTRGIGISSNSERFLQASLYNVDDLGARLSLPQAMVDRKRNEIVVEFGRKALLNVTSPVPAACSVAHSAKSTAPATSSICSSQQCLHPCSTCGAVRSVCWSGRTAARSMADRRPRNPYSVRTG